jgi:hypothetical protein
VRQVLQPVARARTRRWMMRATRRCVGPSQIVEEVVGWWCSPVNRGGGREQKQGGVWHGGGRGEKEERLSAMHAFL